mgnify:CR=1 FL=1
MENPNSRQLPRNNMCIANKEPIPIANIHNNIEMNYYNGD